MCKWISWRSITTVALALVAIIIFKQDNNRSRRAVTTDSLPTGTSEPRADDVASDVTAIVAAEESTPFAGIGATAPTSARDRVARAPRSRPDTPASQPRKLPRAAIVAVLAVLVVPATVAITSLTGSSPASPNITAEAVDTEQGVLMLVRGEHFDANSSVRIFWHHPDDDAVTVAASPAGDVLAYAPMPGAGHEMPVSADGTIDLIATDGVHETSIPFPAPAHRNPSGSVLGATASSRVQVNGAPYFLLGANYAWNHYGNDFGSNAWGSMGVSTDNGIAAQFADMKAKGVHVARWWVFADGRAGINFAADGTPTGLQPSVYTDLNAAIALARQNGIFLDLVLFDVSMLAKPTSSGGVQLGGHTDLLTDAAKRNALVNNVVKPLATAYANEPAIMSWELMNEPEWALSDLPSAAVNANMNAVTMQQWWSFASSASALLHFYTPDQVTVGSAALKWNKVWTDSFAASRGLPQLHLDFYQTHYYQWMDCCSTNDSVLGTSTWSPLTQKVSTLGLDKPIVVGEVHTPTGTGGAMLDTILANGYAGVWGWSYNSGATGDKLVIDWGTYTPWEAAHAAIVRIPPINSLPQVQTATAAAATRTSIAGATSTGVAQATATRTKTPIVVPTLPPTITRTAAATVTATRTPIAVPSTSTRTTVARATRTNTPTATRTTGPTATRTTPSVATQPPATATRTSTPTATRTTSAATPTSTPATLNFGHMSTAGTNDDSDWNYINGTNVTLTGNGTLASLSAFVGSAAANSHIRLGLYASTADGSPGAKIADTADASAIPGWVTIPSIQHPAIASGNYWIMTQTDAQATVFRVASGAGGTASVGWTPLPYGAFPSTIGAWQEAPNYAMSAFGTIQMSGSLPPQTPVPTAVVTNATASPGPTMGIEPGTTIVPMTATRTSTPTATTAPAPTPTSMPTNGGGCVSNCGDPRYFCDTWSAGGFCDDFRGKTSGATQIPFPAPADPYSFDCFSSTNVAAASTQPYYDPSMELEAYLGGEIPAQLPFPCGFSANEHIMSRMEDSQFGMAVMRLHQPFDFAGREGHFHFDVDLKTSARRYVRLILSPELTKAVVDDRRQDVRVPANEFALWFANGRIDATVTRNDVVTTDISPTATYFGVDNVRDHIDVYLTRTHVRVTINGAEYMNTAISDLGFDRAYPYLAQVSYNPCKTNECSVNLQQFHWDNIAFDGPVLPDNSLTPAGSQDVMFNVYSATACAAKGYAAKPTGDLTDYRWQTWVARVPANITVTAADVTCSKGGAGFDRWDGIARAFEIVKQ